MTWRGKGRSGIGDQYLTDEPMSGASYENWGNLSPNGHQFKNAFTQEVRDLSGAEYWKSRKANNPVECDLENHFNNDGSANINAYADQPTQKKQSKTAFEKANLADSHYERLEKLSQELDTQLDDGELSFDNWVYARKQLDKRLDRAWQRVCQSRQWNPEEVDTELYSVCLESLAEKAKQKKKLDKAAPTGASFGRGVVEGLSDDNCFKSPLKKMLTAKEKLVKIMSQTRTIIKE